MEFYKYFEKTENIPGYGPGSYMYDIVLKLLYIAKAKASEASLIEGIVQRSKEEFQNIIDIINTSRIPRRDKEGNIIYKTVRGELVAEADTITFQNFSAKELLEIVFKRFLPTFLVFLQEVEKRGYIKDSQKSNIIRILGDLNQMYKNPKAKGALEKLEAHLTFQVDTLFDREAVLNDAEDAVYLVEQLFNRKTDKGNDHDKKMYNETFRVFKKLKEYVLKIQETEGNIASLSLSQDEDDLLSSEAGLIKISPEQKVIRKPHNVRKQNFSLPGFANIFTKDPETGKAAYLKDVDTRKKEFIEIGTSKGEDVTGLAEQRDFFGYTKVFNDIMNKIIEQKKSGALRTISSDDRRDLQSYFAGRKPFAVSLVETSWYDRFDPYNESKWFFRKPEAALLKSICQARVIATGKRFSYDVELIYDDFIYLLRTFLNGNVKTSGGAEISLEQGSSNDSQKIKEVVTQYTREGNLFIRGETSSAERYTKKAAALQRSIELEKKKQSGEKPLSKKDEMDYERKIKQLKDELDSVMRGESELLTDILSLEKMREEDSEFEIKELEDLENFAVENIRIINIKKTKNLLSPKISPKPSTDTEIKNILSRILKRSTNEITSDDIRISKEIFSQDSNTFFNRKAFLIDYIQKLKGVEMAANSIMVTEPIDMPKDIKDNKQVADFLKKVFITKGYVFNDEEITAAKNVLKTVEDVTIDKNFFKTVYDVLLKEKVAEIELSRLEKFKETSEKELLVSDLGSNISTNMYSNRLYLQVTDLSQEIKFSHKVTGLSMVLRPDNEKDSRSGGEFHIYASRRVLDEFLKKNPYLVDFKNKNPLNDKQLIIESELSVSDSIPIIRGTYETDFISSPMLSAGDNYDIKAGYLRSSSSRREFAASGMNLDKMLDLAKLAGSEKTRIKKELLTRARKKSNQMRRRLEILAGNKPKKRITNNYLKASRSLLELFQKQKSVLTLDTKLIEAAIKDYDQIINEDQKIVGPKAREKAANEIRKLFTELYKKTNKEKNELISDNLESMIKIIKERRLTFLRLIFKNNAPPRLVFDSIKYDGSYENSYLDLQDRFNSLFEKYHGFVFTKPNTLLEGLNQIESATKMFNSLLKSLVELVNLISTPEIEEQYGGRSSRGMRLERPLEELDESVKLIQEAVKVREVGSKYQKIQILKPTKFSILEETLRRNEIK